MKEKKKAGEAGHAGNTRLRREAEKKDIFIDPIPMKTPSGELHRLIYELQVHQIELEVQNDQLRRAQAEIEESRQKYADLYDFAPVGYITLDEAGFIEEINLSGSQMLGTDRSFLIGKPFITFLKLPDLNSFTKYLHQSFKTEEKTTIELNLTLRRGILSVQMTSVPVRVEGQKARLRIVISDITVRKKAEDQVEERTSELTNEIEAHRETERKLAEREENFRRIMEIATDGILIIKKDALFKANVHMAEMLGYAPEELLNSAFRDLVYSDEWTKVEERFKSVLEGKETSYSCETRFVSKRGEAVPVKFSFLASSWKGERAGLMVVRDIALDKKLEENRIGLQRLESLGVLAGGIAHDFNNILTGILGSIFLADYDLPHGSKGKGWLAKAKNGVLRAKELTQQLLTFSKGGAPVKEVFSIRELLRESASFALSGSNIKCEYLIPDDLLNVFADKGQINQVIHNIMINAMQAMPEGGVIKVRAENKTIGPDDGFSAQEGEFVKISIEDHGQGISEDDLQRIFDPYFTSKPNGSGLGLASAHSIVKRHGGHISVTSKIAIGSTFEIYLPASDEAIALREEEDKELVTGSGRVLVMDDEALVRELTGAILRRAGYEVDFAKDGNQAIDLYREADDSGRSFDLVVMDLTIPGGMGGKEAIKKLRALYPDVRAIVSSGYSNDPIMAEWKKYGFNGVVVKPYSSRELTKTVNNALLK